MTGDDLLLPFLEEEDAPPTVPRPVPSIPPKRTRGFAAMDPDIRRAIASKGGRAAHEAGTAHRWTAEEASRAGKKGGVAPHVRRGGPRRKRDAA